MATIVFDIEVAPNMFLLMGKIIETGEYFGIWGDEEGARESIKSLFKSKNTFVSFNGARYDMPVISYFLSGHSALEAKGFGDIYRTTCLYLTKKLRENRECTNLELFGRTCLWKMHLA